MAWGKTPKVEDNKKWPKLEQGFVEKVGEMVCEKVDVQSQDN